MASYHGDIRLGDTIDIGFDTVSTAGVPTTLAGTPVISAYIGNSTTQLTAGITLTVDFDGVTGMHNVRVVATAANGYAAQTNVCLRITAGTVGGSSVVGYSVGSFSIENRNQPGLSYRGTAQAVNATTLTLPAAANFATNSGIGKTIVLKDGANEGASMIVTSSSGDVMTGAGWSNGATPSGTPLFEMHDTPPSDVGVAIAANATIVKLASMINGTPAFTSAALSLSPSATPRYLVTGKADSGSTTTTLVDSARTEAAVNHWKDQLLVMTSGTLAGQSRPIASFNPANDTITIQGDAFTSAISLNDDYEIWPSASNPTAAIADAVLDEIIGDHTTLGSLGKVLIDNGAKTAQLTFGPNGGVDANIVQVLDGPIQLNGSGTQNIGG
jgi:hypothetical protein